MYKCDGEDAHHQQVRVPVRGAMDMDVPVRVSGMKLSACWLCPCPCNTSLQHVLVRTSPYEYSYLYAPSMPVPRAPRHLATPGPLSMLLRLPTKTWLPVETCRKCDDSPAFFFFFASGCIEMQNAANGSVSLTLSLSLSVLCALCSLLLGARCRTLRPTRSVPGYCT